MDGSNAEPLRIGLLGAARISESALVGPARATGHRVVVVAARDRGRAEAYAAAHGIERVADSYADVVADPGIDVVYNPLANGLHGPWNLAAIGAGKHVLSEKPFASTAAEAAQVRDAGRSAGVAVMEAFHYLYHPVMLRVEELMDAGEIGELRAIEVDMVMAAPPDGDPRWDFDLAGGSVMDVGCYGLHVSRYLGRWAGGEPRVVEATADERAGHPGVDERLTAHLEYPGGATSRVRSDMASPDFRFGLQVIGTRGEIEAPGFVLPHADDRVIVTTGAGQRVEHLGTRPSYEYQLEAFAAHVRQGAPLRNDLDDAVAQAVLIDACYRAAAFPLRPTTVIAG